MFVYPVGIRECMVILWPRHAGGIASATQHGNCSNSRSCASGCCLERTLESCKAMRHTVDMYVYSMCLQDHSNREFRIKEVKTQKNCSGGGAHGGCIQDLESFEIKFAHGIYGGLLLERAFVFFFDFSRQASRFVQSTVVRSALFRRDVLLELLIRYDIISAVTALQPPACGFRQEY